MRWGALVIQLVIPKPVVDAMRAGDHRVTAVQLNVGMFLGSDAEAREAARLITEYQDRNTTGGGF